MGSESLLVGPTGSRLSVLQLSSCHSNSHYSQEDSLMQMLRCLFFIEAHFQLALEQSICQGNKTMKRMTCLVTGCPPFQKRSQELILSLPQFPLPYHSGFSTQSRLDISHLETTVHFFCSKGFRTVGGQSLTFQHGSPFTPCGQLT